MRTAEEIIKERFKFYNPMVYGNDVELSGETVSELINEARIEAIKECSILIDDYKSIYTSGDRPIKGELQVCLLKLIDQIK